MNILIPHHWLLEHLKTDASPKKIQEYLSLCGPSVERLHKVGRETVYDIEVTTNRVDSLSVRGIAREAAVILPQFDVPAKLIKVDRLNFSAIKPTTKNRLPLPKIRNNSQLCGRVVCVVLSELERTPTPSWMAERLTQIGVNIHDSVVDITNYITHELGHPVHAFDYDQIMRLGGEIIVTKARKGERFTTLDGAEYQAVGGEVVFKNPTGEIIDLPAIKGTLNSSVTDQTKNILLWLESIEPAKVRFASMTHAIRTVAAQLAEKGVDPQLMEPTLARGVELYQELCQAQVASEVYDTFPGKKTPKPIVVDTEKIQTYLGVNLPLNKIIAILEKLEFKVKTVKNTLHVTPPSFRSDATIPADIIEEIARVYGYHQLPSVIMPTRIPLTVPTDVNFSMENLIKHFLANIGWQEVYTYSMVSEILAAESGQPLTKHVKLANPLTEDKAYLRRSLTPSLKEVLTNNSQRTDLSVFELTNVYEPQSAGLPKERLRLGLLSTKPYRQVRGVVESLLRQFYLADMKVVPETDNRRGALKLGTTSIGTITAEAKTTAVEIDLAALLPLIKTHPNYQPLPKTASIIEQFTFTLPAKTPIGPVLTTIAGLDRRIKKVTLEDIYQANYSLSVEYWDPKQNLSNEDVRPLRQQLVRLVEKTYQAKLVGAL